MLGLLLCQCIQGEEFTNAVEFEGVCGMLWTFSTLLKLSCLPKCTVDLYVASRVGAGSKHADAWGCEHGQVAGKMIKVAN